MNKSVPGIFQPSVYQDEPPAFVYAISPIDHRWEALETIESVRKRIVAMDTDGDESAEAKAQTLQRFDGFWAYAQELAKTKHWEGDVRGKVHVFWIPMELSFCYGFVWKQENNGTTYIVSPIPMPHLQELDMF